MNNCEYTTSHRIQRYLDGELGHDEVRDVESHLALCPACKAELAAYSRLGNALRSAFDVAPAPDLTARFVRRARDAREQSPRRIALGLLAAASILFVSSLFLVVYTETGRIQGGGALAQWEENVVWAPSADDEFADPEAATLYAIHLQANGATEYGND